MASGGSRGLDLKEARVCEGGIHVLVHDAIAASQAEVFGSSAKFFSPGKEILDGGFAFHPLSANKPRAGTVEYGGQARLGKGSETTHPVPRKTHSRKRRKLTVRNNSGL